MKKTYITKWFKIKNNQNNFRLVKQRLAKIKKTGPNQRYDKKGNKVKYKLRNRYSISLIPAA